MPILVYDADCGFCTQCANWVRRRSDADVVPWQSLDLDAHALTERDVTEAAWWLDTRDQLSGARAVAAALRSCGRPWRWLGVLIDLAPVRPLAKVVYRWVARYRYRLPGSTCAVPPR